MNSINLVGRLTRDPELRETSDGRDVCGLRIAVDNGREREPTYVDVSTFDASAKACAEHLGKGRQVAVDGRLIYQEWSTEEGDKRSKHSVIGRVEFLGSRSTNGDGPAEQRGEESGAYSEDIPF